MACPFFHPTEPVETPGSGTRRQVPLGDTYDGECRASAPACHPNDEELKNWCNLGYVREWCPRFLQSARVDAARFTVSGDRQDTIVITYVLEGDHRPLEHGRLEYGVAHDRFRNPPADPNVHQQALAYVRAYLRRKKSPATSGGPSRR